MPSLRTTLSVHPEQAERLRRVKRDRDLENLDVALDQVLTEVDTGA